MLFCPICRRALGESESSCPTDGAEGEPASLEPLPEEILGRFTVLRPFARGASGDLYVADDRQTERRGLLKLIRLSERATPSERARLRRELDKQQSLAQPQLVVPIAHGEASGRPWLFRELVGDVSLRARLATKGPFSVADAVSVTARIAGALDELHRSGLLHRDIKPGHVLVVYDGERIADVRLIDSGVAAKVDTGKVFAVVGSPAYLSPEQANGKLVSFRSDLYSLGCLLFELLSGRPLFSGTTDELLEAHASGTPPDLPADLPAGLAKLLSQLLAKEPRERPFSAQQVRRALSPFLPAEAAPTGQATSSPPKLGASVPPPPRRPRPSRPAPPKPASSATSAGAGEPGAGVPDPNITEELSPLDLEQAEQLAGTPARSGAPSPAPSASLPSLSGIAPEAGVDDPEDASDVTEELEPVDLEMAEAVVGDPGASDPVTEEDEGGLDYDDLAETVMYDRDRKDDAPVEAAPVEAAPVEAAPVEAAPVEAAPARTERLPERKLWPFAVAAVLLLGCVGTAVLVAGTGAFIAAPSPGEELAAVQGAPAVGVDSAEPVAVVPAVAGEPTSPEIDGSNADESEPDALRNEEATAEANPMEAGSEAESAAGEEAAVLEEPEQPETAEVPSGEPTGEAPPAEPAGEAPAATDVRTSRREAAQAATEPSRRREPASRPARPTSSSEPPAPAGSASSFEAVRAEALGHYRARRFPQAAAAYERATRINSRHAGSFAGLGACYLAMGRAQRAVRAYQRAIQLAPRHAGFYTALGHAYQSAGDTGRARQSYTRALALDPSNRQARAALQRVGG